MRPEAALREEAETQTKSDEAIVGPEAAPDERTRDDTPASKKVLTLEHRKDLDTLEYRDKFGKTKGRCNIDKARAALSEALSKAEGNAPLQLEPHIDLCGIDFREWDFSGAKLVGVELAYCDLRKANMKKTNLSESNLHGATLK